MKIFHARGFRRYHTLYLECCADAIGSENLLKFIPCVIRFAGNVKKYLLLITMQLIKNN
jgi:hypothetical protein